MKIVNMKPEDIALLERLNKNALKDEDVFFIMEMNQDTGEQNLIAAPNLMCPVYGPPAVVSLHTALGEADYTKRTQVDPMAAAVKFMGEGRKVYFAVGHLAVAAPNLQPCRVWSLAREVYVQCYALQDLVDAEAEHAYIPERDYYVQDKLENGTPMFKQAINDEGDKLYRWHAVPFVCRELAQSYIKERGVDNCIYLILKADSTIQGENTMEALIEAQEAEDRALAEQAPPQE